MSAAEVASLEARLTAALTPHERISTLSNLSYALTEQGDPARGLGLAEEALALAGGLRLPLQQARASQCAGLAHLRLGSYPEAVACMQTALTLGEQAQHLPTQAASLNMLGSIRQQAGDLAEALGLFERGLAVNRSLGDTHGEAILLNNLARVYEQLGDFQQVLELTEASLSLRRQEGQAGPLPLLLNNLGHAHLLLGQYGAALERLHEALDSARATGNRLVEAYVQSNLAKVQEGLGRPALAWAPRQAALALARVGGDRSLEAEMRLRLGEAHSNAGERTEAQALLAQALELYEVLGEKRGIAQALLGLSGIAEQSGEFAQALGLFRRHHDVVRDVQREEAERHATLLTARFQTEAARREAELERLQRVELTQINARLRQVDQERSALIEQLDRQAHHDNLTGLPNRRLFHARLQAAAQDHAARGATFALLYLDLNGFKPVNDRLGHAAGDELLQVTAARLGACVRQGDTVARLGGDEFTVLACNVNAAEAGQLAERVSQALARPILLQAGEVQVSASIGQVLFPDDGQEIGELLRRADAAMYEVKRRRPPARSPS